MKAVRAALVFALLLRPAPRPQGAESPTQIVALATRAVEHDSVTQATAAWTERLRHDATDRAALLGLSVLAGRTYHFASAVQFLDRLTAPGSPADSYAAYGAIEQAKTLFSRGMLTPAESAYASAKARGRAAHDAGAEFESTLGLAMARARTLGATAGAKALDSLKPLMPRDARLEASWRCERASLAANSGERDAGILASEGIKFARRAGDTRLEARCTWILAQDYVREGDLGTAAVMLAHVETMLASAREHAGLAAVLQWHGYLEVSVGNYGPARQLLQRAVREGETSGNLSALAWSYLNLGRISFSMNDLTSAEDQAVRAESSFKATRDRWGTATAMGLRGEVAMDVGDVATARTRYSELLDWSLREHNLLSASDARLGLADLAVRRGDWREAQRRLDALRVAYRKSGSAGWTQGLDFYDGVLALHRGSLSAAARDVRADLTTLDSSQHVRRYLSQATLAEVSLRQGDTAAAERDLRAASAQLDAWRATLGDRQLRLLAFQVRDAFGGRPAAIASLIAGIAHSGRVDAAFELAERRRARVLRDQLARAAGLRLAAESTTGSSSGGAGPVSAADVRRAIPNENTVLFEYVAGTGGQPTTLFVLTRHDARAYVLAPLDSLRDAIARYSALLENGGDPRTLAVLLGNALLAPAMAALPSAVTTLVIVPDDALWRIPFGALAMRDGRWVIERHAVATSPSAGVSVMLWRRAARTGTPTLLAFGDPRFGAGGHDDVGATPLTLRSRTGTRVLPRLPGTAREVREVARFFPSPMIRLRDDASEAFLEHAPLTSYRVIHFATHAVVDDNGTTRAFLALSPGGGADGFVSDGDLGALHLNADLVVLSACHTAGGTVLGGEGVRGLTAPLLQAGARSIVASEWPVDDARTVSIVVAFYTALAHGLASADALRDAELGAMRSDALPREWAAFRLVGDPTVRVPLRGPRRLFGWPWWR